MQNQASTPLDTVDIAVIGGGINGCGIARDAVGRGWSVFLCEADDLASATSSASTKLVHGGLRYLEYYEFRLVREALMEREVLWGMAPHIVWPLRFVLPHHKGLRPAWLLRLGVLPWVYLLAARFIPGSVELKRVLVVQAAMPTAVISIIIARVYGGRPLVAVQIVLGTTALALFTIPFWLRFGMAFAGLVP